MEQKTSSNESQPTTTSNSSTTNNNNSYPDRIATNQPSAVSTTTMSGRNWMAPMGLSSMTRYPSSSSSTQATPLQTSTTASAHVSSIRKGGRMSAQLHPTTSSSMRLNTTTTTTATTVPTIVANSIIQPDINRNNINTNNSHPSGTKDSTMMNGSGSNHPSSGMSMAVGTTDKQQSQQQPSNLRGTNHNSHLIARTQFCQYDVLACINCSTSPDTDMVVTHPSTSTTTTTNTIGRKLGPLLLDLRRLNFFSSNHDETTTTPSLFSTTVMAQSRGNPSLGSSIYSTCLSVQSHLNDGVVSSLSSQQQLPPPPPLIATGLSTGALCIHSFAPSSSSSDRTGIGPTDHQYHSTIEYYQLPRNNRPATSVAWRPHHASQVAIGYANSTGTNNASGGGGIHTATTIGSSTNSFSFVPNASSEQISIPLRRAVTQTSVNMGGGGGGGSAGGGGGLSSNPSTVVDRQYCCFLWDVEHQASTSIDETTTSSPPIRRTKTTPLYKLSHNQGVFCLNWILDEAGGQILAVGGQQRNIQLYDLRISGSTSTPVVQPSPISAFGHSSGIHGIEADPTRPWHFCTFASTIGEVVKIWDVRQIDSPISEIKPIGTKNSTSTITSAKWSTLSPGHLSILVGETTFSTYDTLSTVSRPIFTSTIPTDQAIKSFTHYPYANMHSNDDTGSNNSHHETSRKRRVMLELFPKQIVAVSSDHTVNVVSCHRIAPLAVSPRNGQIVHSIGPSLLLGSTSEGPAAMEGSDHQGDDDISAIILRRAHGSDTGKYSMDLASNIDIITEESLKYDRTSSVSAIEQLLRLWKWIKLTESFCLEDTPNWPAKSLIDAGVAKLLESDQGIRESQSYSDSLGCSIFDSQGRRAALASCGWTEMSDVERVMTDCENGGEYERSAALAIWHGNIGLAVDALERGSVFHAATKKDFYTTTYSETLEHIALSIAGYQVGNLKTSSTNVWRRSCTKLLQRPDLSDSNMSRGTGYLRHILKFLMAIGEDDGHKDVLVDTALSFCDRVAFACRFLSTADMMMFVDNCIRECQSTGNVEGLSITGLGTQGINILQSYVDVTADIQTAALVTSRVIYPQDWPSERRTVDEWLYSYRTLLNTWQMWQIRAIFDVDRASVQRVAKMRLQHTSSSNTSNRSRPIPAQLDARCNYCSAPLGLRRQENPPNQWLSKMKNVLPCCPRCRKPLPRCAICMLSLGVPNPYYELTKDRPRTSAPGMDDLSTLANLPFAEWFSWCLRCKHGGHAHHLMGWFSKHEVCPVSGCTCRCQFDGIRELQRPSRLTLPVTPPSHYTESEK